MRRLYFAVFCMLSLSACGYHLVGQGGEGVIPEDATQVIVSASGNAGQLLSAFRQKIAQSSDVPVVNAKDARNDATGNSVEIRLEHSSESMNASAFDAAGIANQYRVTISASLYVSQSGKELWRSGNISVSGDVFATGGVVAIEAQKQRVAKDLRAEWVQKALGRLRSGF